MRLYIFLAAILLGPPRLQAEIIEQIVCSVNEKPVTETHLKKLRKAVTSRTLVDELVLTPTGKEPSRQELIEAAIAEQLMNIQIKANSLEVTAERVEQEIQSQAKRNNMTRDQFKVAVQNEGIDFSEYFEFLKQRIQRQSLIDKVVSSKVRPSDEEVAEVYYKKQGQSAKNSYEYYLAHILIRPTSGDVIAAEKRAALVLSKLKNNESFEILASQYSEDPKHSSGGILGQFTSGELSKEFDQAVQGLAVNGVSGVVKSQQGFHILKLLNKKLIPDPNFEKEKEQIRNQLYQVEFKRQFQFWLDQQRRTAVVRING